MRALCSLGSWLLLASVAALDVSRALASEPDSVPGPQAIAQLRLDLSRADLCRVTSRGSPQILRDLRIDSSGVSAEHWGSSGRPALITSPDLLPPRTPPPISWSEISRIETGRPQTLKFALGGLLVGALVGAAVWQFIPTGYDGGQGDPLVVVGVPAAAGLVLGGLLGAHQYRWEAVYPGRPARD